MLASDPGPLELERPEIPERRELLEAVIEDPNALEHAEEVVAEVQRLQGLEPSQFCEQVAFVDVAEFAAANGVPHRAGQGQPSQVT